MVAATPAPTSESRARARCRPGRCCNSHVGVRAAPATHGQSLGPPAAVARPRATHACDAKSRASWSLVGVGDSGPSRPMPATPVSHGVNHSRRMPAPTGESRSARLAPHRARSPNHREWIFFFPSHSKIRNRSAASGGNAGEQRHSCATSIDERLAACERPRDQGAEIVHRGRSHAAGRWSRAAARSSPPVLSGR